MNITKNKIINKYSIIGSSLLFFYIFCTLWIEKFVEIQDWPTINENWKNIGISGIITFEILWIYFYFKPKLEIKENPQISKLNFFIPLIISSIVLFIYYFAYYPGFFVYDSFGQIEWTKNQSNWHPVIHTLLSIKIPLKLANNHIEIITFLQSIYYILALSYFIYALRKVNFSKWFCSIILIQSLLTPYSINILSVEKDYLFAIFCILTLSFYIQIISIPNWLTIPKAILFGIIITMCTLLRNNAPLFTFPLIINLFIFKKSNKNFLNISILSGLTLYFIIINPIYKTYNVYKSKNYLKIETTGIPFTIIGSIAKNDFDKFSTETQNDLLSIAPKTIWEKYEDTIDKYNGWNSIKFLIHWKRLNDTPLKRIFEIMFEAIQINPKKAL